MADVLFSGCRSGRFPLEYAASNGGDTVLVHVYDAYQARKIREDVGTKAPNVSVMCSERLPPDAMFSKAFYHATSKLVSAELELDTLQDIHMHMADGARLVTEGVPPETLGKLFGAVSSGKVSRRSPVRCECVKKGALKRVRSFRASFEASVPGGGRLAMVSLPGCFCHRRPDEGGLALAEVVAARIAGGETPRHEVPVVDIGCGCGLVGLLVADALKRKGAPGCKLSLIDSHARAVAAARINSDALGFGAECLLSDTGLPENHPLTGRFELALANPPYYGEGRMADKFAEIACAALAEDGACWMVAKTPDIITDACNRFFRDIEAFRRRGYTVLRATHRKMV